MENTVLLGATEVSTQYDGSGVFNPNTPTSDSAPASSSLPEVSETDSSEQKPTTGGNSGILLYAGLALAAYFFFFKSKK